MLQNADGPTVSREAGRGPGRDDARQVRPPGFVSPVIEQARCQELRDAEQRDTRRADDGAIQSNT